MPPNLQNFVFESGLPRDIPAHLADFRIPPKISPSELLPDSHKGSYRSLVQEALYQITSKPPQYSNGISFELAPVDITPISDKACLDTLAD